MRGRDPARVMPSCVVKVQARARLVILAREAFGGESAEGAAGGRDARAPFTGRRSVARRLQLRVLCGRGHDALGRARCAPFIAAPQPDLLSGGLTATPADKPGPMPGR